MKKALEILDLFAMLYFPVMMYCIADNLISRFI